MDRNRAIVAFYNLISNSEAESYTDIPYNALRVLSVIPSHALAIPLCIDLLDSGKSYAQIAILTGLTRMQIRVVAAKAKKGVL